MNIFEAYNKTKKELESAGIEDYVFEAKQIIKHITGFSNSEILMNYTNQLTEYQRNNKAEGYKVPVAVHIRRMGVLRQGVLCGPRRAGAAGRYRNAC